MLKYIFFIFLAYFLYQLIFKVILPVYRTTRQIKKGFREMQERMNAHGQSASNYQQTNHQSTPEKNKQVGDYIDFEEIKE
ncbi:MAG TPA: hypothetical protein VD794_09455 [Flavisolibacter sp.]|nr:hypothetical protein [Flavisolibacter sp.]